MNNLESALEELGQLVFDEFGENTPKEISNLFLNIRESYVIVPFPESQLYMEEEWFEQEAILEIDGNFGSSAYFIPLHRVL